MVTSGPYWQLLRLVDTRHAGEDFPDMLAPPVRRDRLAELGVPDVTGRALTELRELRDVLAGAVLGQPEAASLNGLLRHYRLVLELTGDLVPRYVSERDGPLARLAEQVIPQALELLRSGDARRLAICAADGCAAPFVGSPAGRPRSFCSPRCAGRQRARRFRAAGVPGGTP